MSYVKQDGLFEDFDASKPLNPEEFKAPKKVAVYCKGPLQAPGPVSAKRTKDSFAKKVLAVLTLKKTRKDDVCVR